MVEPRTWGEEGYVEWCIRLIEMGICCCDDCGGHLVDRVCLACGCRHWIQEPTGLHRSRYAVGVACYEPGRCAHADARRTQEQRERERQARTRRNAEELGDPRR